MNRLEWELQAYGGSKEEILESITESLTYKLSGPGMIVSSYLSDAQEIMEYSPNTARQYINIAKMVMMEFELGFNPR
jgi:hypothetical protein